MVSRILSLLLLVPVEVLLLLPTAQAQVPSSQSTATNTLTRAPAVVNGVEPEYPDAAKEGRLEGDVTMQIDISAEGKVTQVTVIKGAGHGFDEAAVAAMRQFTFSPAEIDGQPAAVQIEYTQHFAYVAPPEPSVPPPTVIPVSLRGRVIERASRTPVAGAAVKVTLDGVQLEPAVTDAQGQFEVRVPVGSAAIEVRDVGHQAFMTHEEIKASEQLEVTYYLMPKAIGTFETIVRGQRDKKEVTRRTLQREELQSVPGSFGDALRVVQDLPGLARTPYSIGGLIVRGSAATDTGTYFDGVQLPLIFHFGAGPSVVNSEFLDRIDFFPGGFGARYGRAIGGILDVDSRLAKGDSVHGSVKIDLIDTGVYLSVPITDELVVSAAARRSYIDAILALVLRNATATTIAPVYYDYQARLDYRPKGLPNHQFKLFFMGSDDLLSVVSPASNGPSFEVNDHQGFQRLMVDWLYHRNELTLRSMVNFGFDQTDVGIGTAEVSSPATVWGIRQDTEFILRPDLILRGGLDMQLRKQGLQLHISAPLNYDAFPGATSVAPLQTIRSNLDQYDFGEYIELEWKTAFGLRVIPSFRLDVFEAHGATHVVSQPRLIVRHELHIWEQPSVLKASWGLYSELAPPLNTIPTFGNPLLPPQEAMQVSAGVEQRFTSTFSADVTGFWSKRSNLAVATANVVKQADGSLLRENYVADGVGNAYGLEIFLRQELTKNFFGWVAYTLSWSKQRDEPHESWYYTPYDERHILTIIGQYRFGSGWQAGGRFRLVTSAPVTPVVGATYSADSQTYSPINGAATSARGPTFNQLDLRVDKIWLFDTWQLGVYLDVQNIYNKQNQDFVQYDYRYQGSRSIPDIPILPTLGVKGVF